ncbi:hypothetical protein ACFV6G_25215 [Streptomyces lavendulae]|uniref:hypothetical protein n=1 Tax=Streptomyces lavendulae TaxID=1914 RepID=UPI0036BA949E
MIDAQRIIALSQQPRQGTSAARPAEVSSALKVLSDLGHTTEPLARPIPWSSAACLEGTMRAEAASFPAGLCGICPIREACTSALPAGAPEEARVWRERADAGRLLAA